MLAINTNIGSFFAQQAMTTNSLSLATDMQRLSTGKRINSAADDVAGLAISISLTSQIRGLNQAVRNANDAVSLIQTAEGATQQITNILQRMRELAVQSSSDTNNDKDRGFLDTEFHQLKDEIDRIATNTQWNGSNILDGTGGSSLNGNYSFQVGADCNQTIEIKLPNLQTSPAADATDYADLNGAAPAALTFAAGVATLDLSALDATGVADKSLGVTIQVMFSGKVVQYKITQDDIDRVSGTTSSGSLQQVLSETVAMGLRRDLDHPQWNNSYHPVVTTTGGHTHLIVVPVGPAESLNASNSTVKTVKGDLLDIAKSDISEANFAYSALQNIDSALQAVNLSRSDMGAAISRLQFAADNMANVSAKAQESRSRIEDTDYSMTTTELAKRNIIQQAAQAMLAQSNQAAQLVLQLLR